METKTGPVKPVWEHTGQDSAPAGWPILPSAEGGQGQGGMWYPSPNTGWGQKWEQNGQGPAHRKPTLQRADRKQSEIKYSDV